MSAYVILYSYERKSLAQYAGTGAAWLMLLIAYSYHYFDQVLPPYYLHRGFVLGTTLPVLKGYVFRALGHLVSPSRGILVYLPIIPFVMYLLVRYRRTLPSVRLTMLSLINLIALGAVVSGFRHWWGGYSMALAC